LDNQYQPGTSYNNVDIYDASSGTWEVTHLSQARQNMAVAVTANKVLFAGGYFYTAPPTYSGASKFVDIYDLSTKSWAVATLSFAGHCYAAVLGNKVYFVGGLNSGVVDIYDNIANTWTTADFQTVVASLAPPAGMGVIDNFSAVGDNIIFWSGFHRVGIRNIATGSTSVGCVSGPAAALFANNSVVFLYANNKFDVYNPATRVWSTGSLNSGIPSNLHSPGATSLNNTIYLGGGQYDNHCDYHTEVYSLTW